MPKIRIDLEATLIDGQALTFKSPADCSQITGLIVYYPEGNGTTSKDFKFVDAHGVDVGSGTISLFAANVLVKVVLDIDEGKAYVQNADTNAYLEGKFADFAKLREEFDALVSKTVAVHSGAASALTASVGTDGDVYLVTE